MQNNYLYEIHDVYILCLYYNLFKAQNTKIKERNGTHLYLRYIVSINTIILTIHLIPDPKRNSIKSNNSQSPNYIN